jgi:hypothetical protein
MEETMFSAARMSVTKALKVTCLLLACCVAAWATVPRGWYLAGDKPADYESGVDSQTMHNGHPSAYLKGKKPEIDGFGTLMQDFRADQYVGKRLRFSAFVKSEGLENWAGLWMRVDKSAGAAPQMLAFDNMQDRPIKGTTDWQNYAVVLDVPEGATGIFFGVLVNGSGSVWMSNLKIEPVGTDVPTTSKMGASATRPDAPQNLNFEQ